MNRFHFAGRLADTPKSETHGETIVTTFRLIRNEYAGPDRPERVVGIPFVMFGPRGQSIAKNSLTGDQLIIEATVRNTHYTVGDEDRYGFDFVADDFEFGAPGKLKRDELADRAQKG
jgi:single-strand DNA-binding protein